MCQTTTDPTVGRFKAYPKRHPSTSLRDKVMKIKLVVRSLERTPIGLSVPFVKMTVKKVTHVKRLKMI